MDLGLYLRVIWRFRYVVLVGFLLAVGLAFLSFVRVTPEGISYRQKETYRATEVVLLTSEKSLFDTAQQANLSQLAVVFVQIANGDIVRSRILRSGPLRGSYQVGNVFGPNNSLQPLISITGFAQSPRGAVNMTNRVSEALSWWIEESQAQQGVPPQQQFATEPISEPRAVLAEGRKLTVPMVIFVSMLAATLGLVFILENLKPRANELAPREASVLLPHQSPRSAVDPDGGEEATRPSWSPARRASE
jgi:hypothetical protein